MNTIPQDLSSDFYVYISAKYVVLLLIYFDVHIVFGKDVQRCYLTN